MDLELQVFVSCAVDCGTELRFFVRAVIALNY